MAFRKTFTDKIIDAMVDFVVVVDMNLIIIQVNKAALKINGYEEHELIGQSINMLIADRHYNQTSINALRKSRSIANLDKLNRNKDGSITPISMSLSVFQDENGKDAGIVCVGKDITGRKRAEEEMARLNKQLESQRQRLDNIIANMPGIVWEVTVERDGSTQNVDFVSNYVETMLGYTIEEWLSASNFWLKIIHHEDRERIERAAYASYAAGKSTVLEFRWIAKDKRVIWVESRSEVICNEHGRSVGLRGVVLDITERKQAEHEVGEAKQFLRNVIDTVPNLIFVKNNTGQFTLVNQAFADTHGMTVDDIVGKTTNEIIGVPEEVKMIEIDDREVFESGRQETTLEHKVTDARGERHWFHTVKRPLISNGETPRFILGVATDLTDRKLLEEQLLHAQKLKSIGQLAAGIAHEINTPTQYVGDNTRFLTDAFSELMTVLKKNDELLKACQEHGFSHPIVAEVEAAIKFADTEYLMEEIPKAIEQALSGVERIGKIVQSMKDFAHPGTVDKRATDLNRAIESTITVASNEWKYVAEMVTDFDKNLPAVPCLVGEFNQVILNMIVNASHAIYDVVGDSGENKGIIKISTQFKNDRAEIRINDTGTGIREEIRRKIFDPFFTTKKIGKGTGQGLAISHAVIVEKHKGTIAVESEVGKGTTFIINLPLNNGAVLE